MRFQNLRNPILNAAGEGLWGYACGMVLPATVLTVILKQHGAGKTAIGSISAIEAAGMMLPSILGAYLFRSRKRRKTHLIVYHYLTMMPVWLIMAVMVLFSHRLPDVAIRWGIMVGFLLFQTAVGIVAMAWVDWLTHLFPQTIRGKVLGLGLCLTFVCSAIGSLTASLLLKQMTERHAFALLYFLAFIVGNMSISTFWLVKDPAENEPESPAPHPRQLLARFGESWRHPNFRHMLVGMILAQCGLCISPLITDYYLSGGMFGESFIVSCGAAMGVSTAAANLLLGAMGDRMGHRLGMLVAITVQTASLVLLLLSPGRLTCILVYAGVGVAVSTICPLNILLETCPHDSQIAHLSLANVLRLPIVVLAPIMAGWATGRFGSRPVFAACLLISIAALIWLLFFVREPRHARPRAEP